MKKSYIYIYKMRMRVQTIIQRGWIVVKVMVVGVRTVTLLLRLARFVVQRAFVAMHRRSIL